MKIAVAGLWHLGCVTAACLADAKYTVIGYDANRDTIAKLKLNQAPLFEPGLDDLLQKNQENLHFTQDVSAITEADIIWVTYDTPVDDNDIADVAFVVSEIKNALNYAKANTLILISSQLPVGTTRQLIDAYPQFTFAYSPENLRLGKAIDVFTKPDRVVVGIQTDSDKNRISTLMQPYTQNIIWMSIESAEMTKHAINAFLATSVVFINELATLCERVGADARDVERGLKSEERIGPKAYLRPGNAIAGGTLARDVNFLIQVGQEQQIPTTFFNALLASNETHKQWSCQRILNVMKNLRAKKIATLGLSYKVGTDTLRRSTAVETCEWLASQGAHVVAYDPAVNELPNNLNNVIQLKQSIEDVLKGADAIVVTTEWPQFTALTADQLLAHVNVPLVFDASGFLMKGLGNDNRIKYYSVGR